MSLADDITTALTTYLAAWDTQQTADAARRALQSQTAPALQPRYSDIAQYVADAATVTAWNETWARTYATAVAADRELAQAGEVLTQLLPLDVEFVVGDLSVRLTGDEGTTVITVTAVTPEEVAFSVQSAEFWSEA